MSDATKGATKRTTWAVFVAWGALAMGAAAGCLGVPVDGKDGATGATEEAICMNPPCGSSSSSSSGGSSGSSSGGILKTCANTPSLCDYADGHSCSSAAQCTGKVCNGGSCTHACTSWSQCSAGWGCSAGLCEPATTASTCPAQPPVSNTGGPCSTNFDCTGGQNLLCDSGTCTSFASASCTSSAGCPLGAYCLPVAGSYGASYTCQTTMIGNWLFGNSYVLNGVPLLGCPANSPSCQNFLNPSSGSCATGLTCLAPNNSNYGCFDVGSQPSGIPAGAVACATSADCPSSEQCWMPSGWTSGAKPGACITPCEGQTASPGYVLYTAGDINPPTIGSAVISSTIVQIKPVHASDPLPTARSMVPPGAQILLGGVSPIRQETIAWADAEMTTYAPAALFASRLQANGCLAPTLLWGTGSAGNYVFYAQCPAGAATDALVYAAECDPVMNPYQFLEVLNAGNESPIVTPSSGYVFVEWDPTPHTGAS